MQKIGIKPNADLAIRLRSASPVMEAAKTYTAANAPDAMDPASCRNVTQNGRA